MPMVNNVAKTLVGQSQLPGSAGDTSVSIVERSLDQLALTLMNLLLKRAADSHILRPGGHRV